MILISILMLIQLLLPGIKHNHYAVMVDDYSVELYSQSEKGTYYKIRHLVLKN